MVELAGTDPTAAPFYAPTGRRYRHHRRHGDGHLRRAAGFQAIDPALKANSTPSTSSTSRYADALLHYREQRGV
jgi:hypothetical protein